MTRQETLRRMKEVLLRRRQALLHTLHGELEHFNTMDERVVGDMGDLAVDIDYGIINSQLAETESRELEQIEYALERFEERQYGVCEACERNIPLIRLKALPYATMCIRCQRESESSKSSSGGDSITLRFDDAHEFGTDAMQPSISTVR